MARASSWILKESRLMGIEVVGWDICKPPGRISFRFRATLPSTYVSGLWREDECLFSPLRPGLSPLTKSPNDAML